MYIATSELLIRSLSLMQPTSNLFYCSCISVLHSHDRLYVVGLHT